MNVQIVNMNRCYLEKKINFTNKKIKFLLILFGLFIFPYALGQCNSNSILEPGEYCDPGSAVVDGDEVFFDGVQNCDDISPPGIELDGILNCYSGGQRGCQLNIENCTKVEITFQGNVCPTCASCDNDNECDSNMCQNFCAGGSGACHFIGSGPGEDCGSCLNVDSCDDYQTPQSCGSGGDDTCNLASRPEWNGFVCEWIDGACRTNLDCKWDCENLYGECRGDGFKYKQEGSGCTLALDESTDHENCIARNPEPNFPQKIACGLYEENFPVFTWINFILSLFLLVCYYCFIARRV